MSTDELATPELPRLADAAQEVAFLYQGDLFNPPTRDQRNTKWQTVADKYPEFGKNIQTFNRSVDRVHTLGNLETVVQQTLPDSLANLPGSPLKELLTDLVIAKITNPTTNQLLINLPVEQELQDILDKIGVSDLSTDLNPIQVFIKTISAVVSGNLSVNPPLPQTSDQP